MKKTFQPLYINQKVWITLLVLIGVTIFLGLIDWLHNRNRVESKDQAKVGFELHWIFLYGLLVSNGIEELFK